MTKVVALRDHYPELQPAPELRFNFRLWNLKQGAILRREPRVGEKVRRFKLAYVIHGDDVPRKENRRSWNKDIHPRDHLELVEIGGDRERKIVLAGYIEKCALWAEEVNQ